MSSESYFLDTASGESGSLLSTPRTPTIEISVTIEVTQTVCDIRSHNMGTCPCAARNAGPAVSAGPFRARR